MQQERLRDGSRKITRITELQGMEGSLKPTGIRPNFSPRLEQAGFKLTADIFGVGTVVPLVQPGKKK